MINKIIYFLHRYICCHLIIYLPHNILATTMLLYTKRQNKINIYKYSFLFSFLVLFSLFLSLSVQLTTFFHQQCKNNDEFNIDSTNAKPLRYW